ncbi:MAG: ABC transporter substrate-binding protein [Hyphomicrobiales bacterium]|nr:ABC transporter substrate-binding protein [Hyphomicrobiales bacterium]
MIRLSATSFIFAALLAALPAARAADHVTFATNWLAEAEHGGFYQAVADGTYAKFGLDVTIIQGGPNKNNALMLAAGKVDFAMGLNMIEAFNAVANHVPVKVVAAEFQKDPQIFMSHPGVGLDHWRDLPKATAYVSTMDQTSVWRWMAKSQGFAATRTRPYNFNPAPFIADKNSIQIGYVTSEPFAVEQAGHFKPNVFLLADHGYQNYSTTIVARDDYIASHADIVQRFVAASALGWQHYLHGNPAAANALIKKANPQMSDAQLAYSRQALIRYGIVESGDALKDGIGAMNAARIAEFYAKMVADHVVPAGLAVSGAYTLRFVNKGPTPATAK